MKIILASKIPRPTTWDAGQALLAIRSSITVSQAPFMNKTCNNILPYNSRRELVESMTREQMDGKRRRPVSNSSEQTCAFCGTSATPEWRKGPDGSKSLCNACGLVFAKVVNDKKMKKAL